MFGKSKVIKCLELELQTVKSDNVILTNRLAEKQLDIDNLEDENKRLTNALSLSENRQVELEKEISELNKEVQELKKKYCKPAPKTVPVAKVEVKTVRLKPLVTKPKAKKVAKK